MGKKKIILSVCSTGSRIKIAASDGRRTWCAQKKELNQEKPLFPMARRLIRAAGGEGLRSVACFCAVRGPGRFTGIRIGLTLARVLQAVTGAQVRSCTLFESISLQAFDSAAFKKASASWKKPVIAVVMKAFRDEYFCQPFRAGRARPVPADGPKWLKAAECREYLAGLGRELFVIGDSEEDPEVYGLAPSHAVRAPAAISAALPDYVIKAALVSGERAHEPLYLKPARYELTVPPRRRAAC